MGLRTILEVTRAGRAGRVVGGRLGAVGLVRAGVLPTLGGAGVRIGRGTVGQQAEGPLTPWEETGSGGLDTWFESPVGHDAMAEGSGGEPGGSYEYLSLMEHYLATLEGEKRHEGYQRSPSQAGTSRGGIRRSTGSGMHRSALLPLQTYQLGISG